MNGKQVPGNDSECSPVEISVLTPRSEFLKAARGKRFSASTLHLQARCRLDTESTAAIRLGLTCSRKLGGAVVRNRARRRLRAAARAILPVHGRFGWDYVLVGRVRSTAECPFAELKHDLEVALAHVHGRSTRRRGSR